MRHMRKTKEARLIASRNKYQVTRVVFRHNVRVTYLSYRRK